jgi:hypothetical protein
MRGSRTMTSHTRRKSGLPGRRAVKRRRSGLR